MTTPTTEINTSTVDRWDDIFGCNSYIVVSLDEDETIGTFVTIEWESNTDYIVHLRGSVFSIDDYWERNETNGYRNLTPAEHDAVLDWIDEQIEVEREMDEKLTIAVTK